MNIFDSICATDAVMFCDSPLIRVLAARHAGYCLAPASLSGDSAFGLTPFVRCDVHLADLQVGRTVLERAGVCQCELWGLLPSELPTLTKRN